MISSNLLFVVLGLGPGAVYSLLGLGLVMEYRSSGVINFAHGAIAMYVAYVFVELRSAGALVMPWPLLPHAITVAPGGLDTIPALAISLGYAALLGLLLQLLVFRHLRRSPALGKVTAAVGLMLALQAVAVLNFGTDSRSTPPILPTGGILLAGLRAPIDRLWLAGVAVALALGLGALYRFTRFGLATRASAENERGASLLGLSPGVIAAQNWMLASVLAGLAGILIVPDVTLDPSSYSLFIVHALAVALVGRFRSFGLTTAAGLVFGIGQAELTRLQTVWTWFPQQGVPAAMPFLVIVVALALLSRGPSAREALDLGRLPSLGLPTRPLRTALVALAAGVVLLLVLHGSYRAGLITSLVAIPILLSLVVLTGYVGQISLAQMSFAGIGAFTLTHLTQDVGVPFPFSLLASAFAVVPVGLVIGLPALRLRGANLAVITLAAAVSMDALLFNSNPWFSGGFAGRSAGSPHLLGIDLGPGGGPAGDYPRAVFGIVVLVVVVLAALLVARLRTSQLGRTLIAVRANERAAASIGIDVARAKLLAFCLSAFLAGLGGGLLAYQEGLVGSSSFAVFTSLSYLAMAYLGGIGRISGAVVAAMLAPTGLAFTAINNAVDLSVYQLLIGGIALVLFSVLHPDGGVDALAGVLHRSRRARTDRGRTLPGPHPDPPPTGGGSSNAGEASPYGNVLVVEGLRVSYGGVVAVAGIDLALPAGKITGLIGPNGAGKTTLIDALTGYVAPDAGRVEFLGEDVTGSRPHVLARRGLVRTFQSVELFEDLTVREHLLAASYCPGVVAGLSELVWPASPDETTVDWALAVTELGAVAGRPVRELSAGQRKLVGLARALARRPRLLLLDEPAAGLDTHESLELGVRLRSIPAAGVTVMLIDHDMGLVLSLCDHVVVMDSGRIIAGGTPEQVRRSSSVTTAYLGAHASATS